MRKGIKPVRMRAGVPDYDTPIYDNPAKFRIKLKRERQIELFAEGKRYYDLSSLERCRIGRVSACLWLLYFYD